MVEKLKGETNLNWLVASCCVLVCVVLIYNLPSAELLKEQEAKKRIPLVATGKWELSVCHGASRIGCATGGISEFADEDSCYRSLKTIRVDAESAQNNTTFAYCRPQMKRGLDVVPLENKTPVTSGSDSQNDLRVFVLASVGGIFGMILAELFTKLLAKISKRKSVLSSSSVAEK